MFGVLTSSSSYFEFLRKCVIRRLNILWRFKSSKPRMSHHYVNIKGTLWSFFSQMNILHFFPQKFRWGGGGVEGVENKRRCGAEKFSRLQELWKPSSVTVKNCNSFEESSWTFNWFIQNDNFFGSLNYNRRVLFRITKCRVESFRTNLIWDWKSDRS